MLCIHMYIYYSLLRDGARLNGMPLPPREFCAMGLGLCPYFAPCIAIYTYVLHLNIAPAFMEGFRESVKVLGGFPCFPQHPPSQQLLPQTTPRVR